MRLFSFARNSKVENTNKIHKEEKKHNAEENRK